MKKFISCVLFMVLLSFTIYRVYNVLAWKDTAGEYLSSMQQLYATEDDLIDVIFVGSSHVYCGIFPEILWGEYGIAGFDMAVSGQDKDSSYHMIKEVLKTQSPKVVCVDMFGLLADKHEAPGNVYRNMLSMKTSKNSIDLVKAYVEEEKQRDYILRWPIIHTRYKELGKYDFVQYEPSIYGRGSAMSRNVGWSKLPSDAIACDEVTELSDKNEKWLNDLYVLSQEENFELILFVAPFLLDEDSQMVINGAKVFAEEKEIVFLDFNRHTEEIGLDYAIDFSDATHLNINGGSRFTSYFGEYLSSNYPLYDNRGDERYWQWEDAYTHYQQEEKADLLSKADSLEKYVETLETMQYTTCVVSLEGTYKESQLNMEKVMLSLGMTKEEFDAGGTFIYKSGKLEKILDEDSLEAVIYELDEYNAFKIQNKKLIDENATNLEDILFNTEPVGCAYNGVTFAVYDEFKGELVNKKGFF